MAQIQQGVAICLATSVVFNSSLLYLNRMQEGKVALPTHDGADDQETETSPRSDPFDVVEPDDLSEGLPINGHAFWTRVRSTNTF